MCVPHVGVQWGRVCPTLGCTMDVCAPRWGVLSRCLHQLGCDADMFGPRWHLAVLLMCLPYAAV